MLGIVELDWVLGGGLVFGLVILVGGDLGIGKFMLLLQVVVVFVNFGQQVIYILGEEVSVQVWMCVQCFGLGDVLVWLGVEIVLCDILIMLDVECFDVVIIDLIQMLWFDQIEVVFGLVSQVCVIVYELVIFVKWCGMVVIFVGYVIKEGQIVGLCVVEYMVDIVLYFEGECGYQFCILCVYKNCFGLVDEIGVFEMMGGGLFEVVNFLVLFLFECGEFLFGLVVFVGIEGICLVLIEVQVLIVFLIFVSLCCMVVGLDSGWVLIIFVVFEVCCVIFFVGFDVFLNVVGGMWVNEFVVDFVIVVVFFSVCEDSVFFVDCVFFGEISFFGVLCLVVQVENRLKEVQKFGFLWVILFMVMKVEGFVGMWINCVLDLISFVGEIFGVG